MPMEIVVVDSAALLNGTRLDSLAKELRTVPEVMAEIRDKKSRESMQTLPPHLNDLKIVYPTEESLKMGKYTHKYDDIYVI